MATKTVVVLRDRVITVKSGMRGPPGPPGSKGEPGVPGAPGGTLSADAGNRARSGTDGGLLVPDWEGTDPLAYYLLARD